MPDMIRMTIHQGDKKNYLIETEAEPHGMRNSHYAHTAQDAMDYIMQFTHSREPDTLFLSAKIVEVE